MKTSDTRPEKLAPLPWMSHGDIEHILRQAIERIERGEPLLHGVSAPGVTYLERDVVVATLRAVADGTPLGKVFRRGAPSKHHWAVIRDVARYRRAHPASTLDAAYRAIAKSQKRSAAAVKKAHQRAEAREREHWRSQYLEGRWPDWHYWNMTDDDIEQAAKNEPWRYVDKEGRPVDIRDHCRARRELERAEILEMTGWRELPPHEGQK